MEDINKELWPNSIKKTKARTKVFDLLEQSEHPRSALEIYEYLIKDGEKVNQSTIYRILETFVTHAMIKKINYSNEVVSYYSKLDNEDVDTIVCLSCKKRDFLEPTIFNEDEIKHQTEGFTIKSHKMELYGYCNKCNDD
ncbi:MAG: Fur family transcriptional regulator [Clostridia bacterium]